MLHSAVCLQRFLFRMTSGLRKSNNGAKPHKSSPGKDPAPYGGFLKPAGFAAPGGVGGKVRSIRSEKPGWTAERRGIKADGTLRVDCREEETNFPLWEKVSPRSNTLFTSEKVATGQRHSGRDVTSPWVTESRPWRHDRSEGTMREGRSRGNSPGRLAGVFKQEAVPQETAGTGWDSRRRLSRCGKDASTADERTGLVDKFLT